MRLPGQLVPHLLLVGLARRREACANFPASLAVVTPQNSFAQVAIVAILDALALSGLECTVTALVPYLLSIFLIYVHSSVSIYLIYIKR